MKITNIRINGITNPIGFNFDEINISYFIEEYQGEPIYLYLYKGKDKILVYTKKLNKELSFCSPIEFKPEKGVRYFLTLGYETYKSEEAFFETPEDLNVDFIACKNEVSHPIFFKEFFTTKRIASARLYITGVGLYEAYINGKKVGNEFLTPNYNDYDEYLQYQTYDVTDLLDFKNKLEILTGNGWYKGRFGLKHKENIYGNENAVCARLKIESIDGEIIEIQTDESWSAKESSIKFSGIYDGELIDESDVSNEILQVKIYDKKFNKIPRKSIPVVIKQQIKPILITNDKGQKILDFGQNFAGFVSFKNTLEKGKKITLSMCEVLQKGLFYRENLRTAKAQFVYVSNGVEHDIRPHFTFFGFRFVLVDGVEKVDPNDFIGNVIYSDLTQTAKIKTNNEKINRLLLNCIWGQRSNFIDVPTDCPQRDERLGWTGDAEVFSKTACYQMDCRAFYSKYMFDVAIDQKIYGNITTYSPAMKEGEIAGSVWADAATIIPYNLYVFYGDKVLLEKQFPMMKKFVENIISQDDARGGKRLYDFGFHLGDWLSQDGVNSNALKGATDEFFIASAYYFNSVKCTAKAAAILGHNEESKYFNTIANEIKRAILKEYFTPSGRLAIDTQTAYSLCVSYGIYKNKNKLKEGFSRRLMKDSYKIKGGFVGATQLIQTLISCGLIDEAFRMLYNESYPGWLACVNLGATTIWERWNSLNEDGSVSGTGMNSLNHYSYGAVAEAFYAYIAGLRPLKPGFKKVIIEPKFNYRLKELNFEYLSPSGKYQVSYKCSKNKLILFVEVPLCASANLKINGQNRILKGGKHNIEIEIPPNMINPFSVDTAVCELIANQKSADILKRNIPILYGFLSMQDIGLNGETLRNIASLKSFYVDPKKISMINEELKKITMWEIE